MIDERLSEASWTTPRGSDRHTLTTTVILEGCVAAVRRAAACTPLIVQKRSKMHVLRAQINWTLCCVSVRRRKNGNTHIRASGDTNTEIYAHRYAHIYEIRRPYTKRTRARMVHARAYTHGQCTHALERDG